MFYHKAIYSLAVLAAMLAMLVSPLVEAQNNSRQQDYRNDRNYRQHAEDYGFALTCVSSATGDTIYFEYRWGSDDDWESVSAEPDSWQMLMWKYDEYDVNNSPQLQIRFDDDLSRFENYVRVDLESYAATSEDCEGEGKTYHFHDDGGELDIHADD